MRFVIANIVASLLVACGTPVPPIGNACQSKEACEIEMYMKAP